MGKVGLERARAKSLGEREALFGSLERPIADEPTRDPGMPEAGPVPRGTLIGDEPNVLCVRERAGRFPSRSHTRD